MLKIRLTRVGRRRKPLYKVVVADSRWARDGKYVEAIGSYDPKNTQNMNIKIERFNYWLEKGAKPTDRVKALIKILNKTTKGGEYERAS